jgi:hypothetical protein
LYNLLSAKTYLPTQMKFTYDPVTLGAAVSTNINVSIPFTGQVELGKASGNLKDGIELGVKYPGILTGTIGVKLEDPSIDAQWDFTAFGMGFKDRAVIGTV